MSNTEERARVKRRKAKVWGGRGARLVSRRRLFHLCLFTCAFFLCACRMDMQDQPRYEAYERADEKTFNDGQASRPLVEGTVARMPAGQPYVDRQTDYFYTGIPAGGAGMPGAGAGAPPPAGVGAPFGVTGAGLAGAQTPPAQQQQGAAAGVQTQAGAADGAAAQVAARRLGGPDVFPVQVTIDEAALRRGRDRFENFCSMCHGLTGEGDGMIVRRGFQRPPSFIGDPGLQEGQASAAHYFQVITQGLGAMPSYSTMIPPEDRWKIIAYIRALQLSRRVDPALLTAEERGRIGAQQSPQGQGGHGGEQH